MPTYEYRCVSCEHQFERFQRMSDEPVAECEVCGQPVKRLLFPVAIHFKGSGFYSTDYGKNTKSVGGSTSSSSSADGSSSASSSDNGSSSSDGAKAAEKSSAPAPAASAAKSD